MVYILLLLMNMPMFQMNYSFSKLLDFIFVGNKNHRAAFLVEFVYLFKHDMCIMFIKVGDRLIGKNNLWLVEQCASHGGTLFLSNT